MTKFARDIGDLIDGLKGEALFRERLRLDIEKGEVFFAIRDGYASFYYKGSSLFTYGKNVRGETGFATHYKYGFVPAERPAQPYITPGALAAMRPAADFVQGYDLIKERAGLYAGVEARGVSAFYGFAARDWRDKRYYLVDVEIAFETRADEERQSEDAQGQRRASTDRIDMLLYDSHRRALLFCEAKHFSNPEVWQRRDGKRRVAGQLEKYARQIRARRGEIMAAYTQAFEQYCRVLDIALPVPVFEERPLHAPEKVCAQCALLVFGYDAFQEARIRTLIGEEDMREIRCKVIGDIDANCRSERTNTVQNIFAALGKKGEWL